MPHATLTMLRPLAYTMRHPRRKRAARASLVFLLTVLALLPALLLSTFPAPASAPSHDALDHARDAVLADLVDAEDFQLGAALRAADLAARGWRRTKHATRNTGPTEIFCREGSRTADEARYRACATLRDGLLVAIEASVTVDGDARPAFDADKQRFIEALGSPSVHGGTRFVWSLREGRVRAEVSIRWEPSTRTVTRRASIEGGQRR